MVSFAIVWYANHCADVRKLGYVIHSFLGQAIQAMYWLGSSVVITLVLCKRSSNVFGCPLLQYSQKYYIFYVGMKNIKDMLTQRDVQRSKSYLADAIPEDKYDIKKKKNN